MKLSYGQKTLLIGVAIALVAFALIGIGTAAYLSTSKVNVPAGTVKSDTYTYSATLNGVAVNDPANINVAAGFVGDVSTVVYTVTSTANQAITVNAVASAGTLDKPSLSLPSSGNMGTFTLTVALTASAQIINVSFSSTAN
jgi:hypothetical protein